MIFTNILLVLPLGALALPVAERADEVAEGAALNRLWKRAVSNPVLSLGRKRADPASDTINPVADLWKRSHYSSGFVNPRSDDGAEPSRTVADAWKRKEHAEAHAGYWKLVGSSVKTAGDFPWHTTEFQKRNDTPIHYQQPDLPEFIDTGACMCGLLLDQSTIDNSNGEIIEMWRCTASVNYDISKGGNGKWYNTTLPSQELSGINEGREWADNDPYVGQTYVLTFQNGGASYQLLDAADSGALFGADANCTGVRDTQASAAWYTTQ